VDTHLEDEDRTWPRAILGPPPWSFHEREWEPEPMDIAVGKFIRIMPWFETALTMTRDIVDPRRLVDLAEAGATESVRIIGEHLAEFPKGDHFWLELYLIEASKVIDLRHAIVHGIWTEADPVLGTYLSERLVRRSQVKKLGYLDLPDDHHPTARREFNAGGVMAGWARARSVATYITKKRGGWAEHFGRA
jgi:hypothetical protein